MKRCWRRCWRYCRSPRVTLSELRTLEEVSGKTPIGVATTPDGDFVVMEAKYGGCPMLSGKNCSVYESRPAICRLWGTHWTLKCPYGCEPTRWLSDDEFMAIMKAIRNGNANHAV